MKKSGVFALAFGAPGTILPNLLIADMASKKAIELGASVFSQKDIQIKPGIQAKYYREKLGNSPPILRICREAVQWATKNDVDCLWLVCAAPHLRRALRDLEYAIREAGVAITVKTCNYRHTKEIWYCQNSSQKQTRSRKAWRRKERIVMHLPMFIYKILAK